MMTTETAGWLLFACGGGAAVSALLVRYPPRWPSVLALAGFVWSWLAGELAWHNLVLWCGAAVYPLLAGGLETGQGVTGLALLATVALPIVAARHDCDALLALARARHGDAFPRGLDVPRLSRLFFFVYPAAWASRSRHRYGPARAHVADVYRPRVSPASPRPVLLYVHGGGWVLGFRRWQGRILFRRLLKEGWSVVSVEYRLSPLATWPDHIVDVKRALAWVKSEADLHGGDTSRVVLAGNSAGGHLAALAALSPNDPSFQPGFEQADTRVLACQAWYGVYDLIDRHHRWSHTGLRRLWELLILKRRMRSDPLVFREASPLDRAARLPAGERPALCLIHGTRDSLVPPAGGRDLAAVAPGTTLIDIPGAQHAFDVFWSPRAVIAVELAARWLIDVASDP